MTQPTVDRIYNELKDMAVSFRMKPGDRLNEGALAKRLGASRTPLREALNRLVGEELVSFKAGEGFFCRELSVKNIFDLFELRAIIEGSAVALACKRASDEDIVALEQDFHANGMQVDGLTIAQAIERDEAFHLGIARLSGNDALVHELTRINDRIRYIRWISVTREKLLASKQEHADIMAQLKARADRRASRKLGNHIAQRKDDVTQSVKNGIAQIYLSGEDEVFSRELT